MRRAHVSFSILPLGGRKERCELTQWFFSADQRCGGALRIFCLDGSRSSERRGYWDYSCCQTGALSQVCCCLAVHLIVLHIATNFNFQGAGRLCRTKFRDNLSIWPQCGHHSLPSRGRLGPASHYRRDLSLWLWWPVQVCLFAFLWGSPHCADNFFCHIRDGTTDVTRTWHFGMPSQYEKVRGVLEYLIFYRSGGFMSRVCSISSNECPFLPIFPIMYIFFSPFLTSPWGKQKTDYRLLLVNFYTISNWLPGYRLQIPALHHLSFGMLLYGSTSNTVLQFSNLLHGIQVSLHCQNSSTFRNAFYC